MAKKAKVALPLAPLPDLMKWWRSQKLSGIVIGGVAVSLLSRPRITREVDGLIVLPEERWQTFLDAGDEFGFLPRESNTLAFAHETRVLLLRHQPSGIDVDLILGWLPFEEEAVARAEVVNLEGSAVSLASPEDLIIMKAVAHREQDKLDIDALLVARPRLNLRRVPVGSDFCRGP